MPPTSLSVAVGAPVERELNGETYTVSPLRMLELGRMESWMREQVIAPGIAAIANSNGVLTPQLRGEIISQAYTRAADVTILNSGNFLSSTGGALHMIWLSLNIHDPNLTIDKVNEVMTAERIKNVDALGDMVETILRISGMAPEPGQEGQGEDEKRTD